MHQKPNNLVLRWIVGIGVLFVISLPVVYSAIVVPLSPAEQAQVSLAMIGFAILASFSRAMRPLIIFLSCFASMRYFYWRVSSTLNLDSQLDATISVLLLAAEIYGLIVLFLGYFQTIEVVRRVPPPVKTRPAVDVFIPTYNESADIVSRTIIGALSIDYPCKKVYVLDDGRRPEIEALAKTLGASYITRPHNEHAKAGNLNHALARTHGELIAIFDADHVPVSGFLTKTVGFFEDPKVALVQTAQHFFNPDPYERNLKLTGKIAPEQHFFYHVIQPGNDLWNSAFFCGSCAVLRRSALEAIGGIKTATVTEDAHTAMELHARGYVSIYLPLPLAAGLATETFAAHVTQRMRWARGMAQILRSDCPLFKRGLSVPQRLNYFNAMFHFFFGIPRLVMILAPLTYLLLGAHPIKADALAVIAYILPHIGLCTIANSMISRNFRHSFWAGVYEISIAPYTTGVTLLALLNPKLGKFNVTDKGTNLDTARFDFRTSWMTLLLLALSMSALMVAFPARALWFYYRGGDPSELDSLLINSLWALANFFTLVAAACVALEQPQQRKSPRVKRSFPCELISGDDHIVCQTLDLSESGVKVLLDRPRALSAECEITIASDFGVAVHASILRIRCDWDSSDRVEAAFAFAQPDAATRHKLVQLMFSGDRSWVGQSYPTDRLLVSFWHLLTTIWRVSRPRRAQARQAPCVIGRWPARYQEREGECLSLNDTGALVRFRSFIPDSVDGGSLRVEVRPGTLVSIPAISCTAAPDHGNCAVVKFDISSESTALRAFYDAVYEARSFAPPRPQKNYVFRRTEDSCHPWL